MKTTVELPDAIFRQAKAVAATQGVTLRHYFTEALRAQLRRGVVGGHGDNEEPPWMAGFGELADLRDENLRVLRIIEDEFERIRPDDLK